MATDFCGITNINLKVDVKIIRESGIGTTVNTGATTVTLTKDFANLTSVQVTPNKVGGGTIFYAVDWDSSIVNPTGFDVYIYNSGGTLIVCDFSFEVTGVQGA